MALRLWTGPSGSGKTRFLFEYVLDEAAKNRELNYIVIVPEQFTLSTQRELIKLSKCHGILNVDVLSFQRLAYRVFEEVGFREAQGASIDDMGKNLILRHIASKCEDKLTVFNGKMDKLGYITEVKSAISEFMQYGIGVDKIPELIEAAKSSGRGQLAAKLSDMEILYKEFNAYIEKKYITKEEILSKASRAAHRSDKLKKSVVVFDGFTGFTPVQYNFLETLLRIARDIHVTILTDTRDTITYNTEHELFYLGFKTSEKLKKLCELNNIPVDNDFEIIEETPRRFLKDNGRDCTSEMLAHLERNLFREYSRPYTCNDSPSKDEKIPTKAVNGGIRVFTALQPIDEVTKVAVEIEKLIRSGANELRNGENNSDNNTRDSIRYKNIAIATGDLEGYAPVFRRVFKQYNIPYFIDKNMPVLLNPFIEYIRAILDVITENFSYSAVFRYLRSPLNDYTTDDIDKLENFVLKHGIKGLTIWQLDWTSKYSRYYKNGKNNSTKNIDEELIALDMLRQKVLDELQEAVYLITDSNRKMSKKPTKAVNEINAVFTRCFSNHNIENRIEKLLNEYSETDETFRWGHEKEYKKIFESVTSLLTRMGELLGEEEITIEEYGELLDAGFDEIRIGIIPTITDYIQIGDITRSRFENVHTLFIVGANDGVIPKSSSSGGIISDIEKEFLIESTPDIELAPTVREQAYSGQLYLYMLMTKPTTNLVLSYSRLNSNSESLRPSYIIKVLTDMFPGLTVEKDFISEDEKIYNRDTLYDAVVSNIKDKDSEELIELLVNDKQYGKLFKEKLLLAADASYMTGVLKGEDAISKAVASVLYGKSIIGSVTKLEQFARCSLSFFLKYGLSLKEREVFRFEARDMGTVFHGVMEKYSSYIEEQNLKWEEIDDKTADLLINRAINECIDDPRYAVLGSSFRHKYLIERIARISRRSVSVLTKHLKAGVFAPKGAELSFSTVNSLDAFTFKLSEDEIMRFTGTIDRLDTYKDDERIYIKIIDYKSGNKSLDLVEVYKGLSLQLVVYMNAAKEIIMKEPENAGLEVVPAGILYYHIDDPIVEGTLSESDDVIADRIAKELKMRGLVNSDENVYKLMDKDFDTSSDIIPISVTKSGELSKRSSAVSTEDFDTISQYVNKKIESIGRDILSGSIKAEPHSAAGVDMGTCSYCPYGDICKFNGTYIEDENSDMQQEIKGDEVLQAMREALGDK